MLTEIKHQVEGGSVAVVGRGFGSTYFYEINNIFVFQQLQYSNFTKGCYGELKGYRKRAEGGHSDTMGKPSFREIELTPSFSFSINTFFIATNLFVVEFFSRALNTSLE